MLVQSEFPYTAVLFPNMSHPMECHMHSASELINFLLATQLGTRPEWSLWTFVPTTYAYLRLDIGFRSKPGEWYPTILSFLLSAFIGLRDISCFPARSLMFSLRRSQPHLPYHRSFLLRGSGASFSMERRSRSNRLLLSNQSLSPSLKRIWVLDTHVPVIFALSQVPFLQMFFCFNFCRAYGAD